MSNFSNKETRWKIYVLLTGGGCILFFILNLSLGSVPTSLPDLFELLLLKLSGKVIPENLRLIETVIVSIRFPRSLFAVITGAGLATTGACLQGLFRNPLADPGLIGISSGSSVGAIFALVLFPVSIALPPILILFKLPIFALVGGALVTFLLYHLAKMGGQTHVSTLLLGGIAVNALAGAIIGGLLTFSTNESLRQFTFWTLGSLQRATWEQVWVFFPFVIIPLMIMQRYGRVLNALLLGEADAFSLGFNVKQIKRNLILWCASVVGATVAFCGLIGFVGLVVPHLVRMMMGPDHKKLIPGSMLMGSLLLLIADLIARTIAAPIEIPIGVITSIIGAPFFIYLIWRRKNRWSWS